MKDQDPSCSVQPDLDKHCPQKFSELRLEALMANCPKAPVDKSYLYHHLFEAGKDY